MRFILQRKDNIGNFHPPLFESIIGYFQIPDRQKDDERKIGFIPLAEIFDQIFYFYRVPFFYQNKQ